MLFEVVVSWKNNNTKTQYVVVATNPDDWISNLSATHVRRLGGFPATTSKCGCSLVESNSDDTTELYNNCWSTQSGIPPLFFVYGPQ